jgi:hypothetical protein
MANGFNKFKNGIYVDPQSADPSSPAEGDLFFSDGTSRAKGLWQYKDGAWAEFGSSGSSGINYMTDDNKDAENGVGDWTAYADAAGANAVDGTGGAPTVTFTQNSTTPLRGTSDFKLAKDAANRQGEGAGCAFTIDKADKSQMLTISFDYDTSDADYADDDIRVQVYDVTNTTLIRVNGEDLKGGKGTHYAQFQAASDSTSYRLILHVSSTNAAAYDVYFDNIQVGPSGDAYHSTPHSCTAFLSGNQTISTTNATKITLDTTDHDTSGMFDSGNNRIVIQESGKYLVSYHMVLNDANNASTDNNFYGVYKNGAIFLDTYTNIVDQTRYSSGQTKVVDLNKDDYLELYVDSSSDSSYTVVSGLKYTALTVTKVAVADEVNAVNSGREIYAAGASNGGTALTANTTNIDFTETKDTTASFDGTTFTAPETGTYLIDGSMFITAATASLRIDAYINGSQVKAIGNQIGSDTVITFSGSIDLDKGDALTLRSTQSVTLNSNSVLHHISINKLASPQTPLDTATVAVIGAGNGGTVLTASTTNIDFTEVKDTHAAFDGTTFTVPITGLYRFEGALFATTSTAAGIEVYIDGSSAGIILGPNVTSSTVKPFNGVLDLNKGEAVTLRSSVGLTLNTAANVHRLYITRVK